MICVYDLPPFSICPYTIIGNFVSKTVWNVPAHCYARVKQSAARSCITDIKVNNNGSSKLRCRIIQTKVREAGLKMQSL